MARLPRLSLPDQPLHVIQRGNNRDLIFAADADYQFYLRCLHEAADTHSLTVHAYVLMTNHVHLLVTPATESSLSKTCSRLGDVMCSISISPINAQEHCGRGAIKVR
jgi:putative transposase